MSFEPTDSSILNAPDIRIGEDTRAIFMSRD